MYVQLQGGNININMDDIASSSIKTLTASYDQYHWNNPYN